MIPARVSEKTIRRLSHYARCLRLAMLRGEKIVTSQQLADNCGISSAAVRRDLSTYGEFGKQGSGYAVSELLATIQEILGVNDPPGVAVVGAGNIGCALVRSGLEGTGGYRYSGLFDTDPGRIGGECSGFKVRPVSDLADLVDKDQHLIAVIAVTPGEGQKALDQVVSLGCRAVLSFNLEPLRPPEGVDLRYVEVSTELDVLTHSMRRREGGQK
jgi:redox-sensing transcriptional repressor